MLLTAGFMFFCFIGHNCKYINEIAYNNTIIVISTSTKNMFFILFCNDNYIVK